MTLDLKQEHKNKKLSEGNNWGSAETADRSVGLVLLANGETFPPNLV